MSRHTGVLRSRHCRCRASAEEPTHPTGYSGYVTAIATPREQAANRRWLILGICCMSLLLIGLDATIVNVALPSIHRSLHASLAGLQWVVDAYTLVLASLLMLSGSTADRIGRRKVFLAGLLLFLLGSALCAVAPTLGVLVGARALQAIGGSMLNPVALSIVRQVFLDPKERAQAIGLWGATMGVSMGLGPVIGGALVDTVGWRYVFLVNIPIGLLAFLLTVMYVPESRAAHARRIDPIGQILVLLGLASLTYAIIEGQGEGWTSAEIVTLFVVAIASFVGLVRYELRRDEPLLDMRFFRSAPFSGASLIALCAFGSFGGFLFLNTLYLQDARGFSAFHAGLCTLPVAAMTIVFAPFAGRLIARTGTRLPLLVAGIGLTVSPLLLVSLTSHTPLLLLIVCYLLFGIGFGFANPPITSTAISGMPPAQAGVAAAVASTSRQTGSTMGIAVAGAVAGATAANSFGPGFAQATHAGWWVLAGLGLIVLVVGAITTTAWAHGTATATAARFQAAAASSSPAS
jgi:EmrB/QacA subfamily drug resistance transporter